MNKFRLRPRRIDLPVERRKLLHILWKTWLCGQSKYSRGGMWERHHMMFSLREIFGLEMKPRLACSLYRWDLRVVLMMRLFEEFCFCFWGDDSLSYLCDHLCWRCLIFPPYIYQFLSIIQVSLWLCPFICFCLCPFCLYCCCWDFLGGYRPLVLFL